MKLSRFFLAIVLAGLTTTMSHAQQPTDWLPQGIEALVFASKLDAENEDLRRVIAGVSGVSVHRYHFLEPWQYDPGALSSVKEEYHSAGWKQLMNNHPKDGGPGVTDLWVRFENNAISNVAILLARANEVDFFVVSGSISPLDLSHLGGHFGIPRIEGGVLVPNNQRHP
jgi:hypothetical protein